VDFSTALGTYAKFAGVLLDGVEAVTGLGQTVAIMGFRKEIDPDAGDDMSPGYFVLVDMPEEKLQRDYRLLVRKNRLCYGESFETARDFRDADYVLFSISSRPDRTDIDSLPFQSLWDRVLKEASVPKKDNWESAKANMLSLYQTMVLSPDLIRTHARQLARDYGTEMEQIFEDAVSQANRSGEEASAEDELADARTESLRLLTLDPLKEVRGGRR
jgi:hypothetical protein